MSLDVYLNKPTTCPNCKHEVEENSFSFDANITHNLGKMADAAGIGDHLWCPEDLGITKAGQLIEPLKEGISKMKANPEYYEQFNASNGWGTYKDFLPWLEEYLQACEECPEANVRVSR